MKTITRWIEKMSFVCTDGQNQVSMDSRSPIGSDSALTPKQLVIAGLAGCTAMDVVALLKKYNQPLESFEVETEIKKSTTGYPEVFTSALLTFKFKGVLDEDKVIEAVTLSQTKYCGVSAMLSKAFPITYRIEINGSPAGHEGQAFP